MTSVQPRRWFLLASIYAGVLVVGTPRTARSCGWWNGFDTEIRVWMQYLCTSLTLDTNRKSTVTREIWRYSMTRRKVRWCDWLLFRTKCHPIHGLSAYRDTKVLFDFRGSVLRLRGKPVGKLAGEKLTIGKKNYKIVVKNRRSRGFHVFRVNVFSGGKLVYTGKPMVFPDFKCRGRTKDLDKKNIRRRVVFYLAWRQLLAPTELPIK